MVVHVEHASVASRTMMAPLWFEDVADQAEPAFFLLGIVQEESPKIMR
jgi:hypothetical protein